MINIQKHTENDFINEHAYVSTIDDNMSDMSDNISDNISDNMSDEPDELKQDNCIICLEDFTQLSNILSLPCKHKFHYKCINKWGKQHNTCPICRNKSIIRKKICSSNRICRRQTIGCNGRLNVNSRRHAICCVINTLIFCIFIIFLEIIFYDIIKKNFNACVNLDLTNCIDQDNCKWINFTHEGFCTMKIFIT